MLDGYAHFSFCLSLLPEYHPQTVVCGAGPSPMTMVGTEIFNKGGLAIVDGPFSEGQTEDTVIEPCDDFNRFNFGCSSEMGGGLFGPQVVKPNSSHSYRVILITFRYTVHDGPATGGLMYEVPNVDYAFEHEHRVSN